MKLYINLTCGDVVKKLTGYMCASQAIENEYIIKISSHSTHLSATAHDISRTIGCLDND